MLIKLYYLYHFPLVLYNSWFSLVVYKCNVLYFKLKSYATKIYIPTTQIQTVILSPISSPIYTQKMLVYYPHGDHYEAIF